jgi:hypothetical protein
MQPGQHVAVLLIHGTFAYRTSTEGTAWWQLGSDFQAACSQFLGPSYEVQPSKTVFRWSGANSELERRDAAKHLSELVLEYEDLGKPYLFVAHSHGGSVLFDALMHAHGERPGLPNLLRWVTVGTPFLRYAARDGLG